MYIYIYKYIYIYRHTHTHTWILKPSRWNRSGVARPSFDETMTFPSTPCWAKVITWDPVRRLFEHVFVEPRQSQTSNFKWFFAWEKKDVAGIYQCMVRLLVSQSGLFNNPKGSLDPSVMPPSFRCARGRDPGTRTHRRARCQLMDV